MNKRNKRRVVITALASTPVWVKPVIKQVSLPAHAQTTEIVTDETVVTTTAAPTTTAAVTTTTTTTTTTTAAPVLTNLTFYSASGIVSNNHAPKKADPSLLDLFISPATAMTPVDLNISLTLQDLGGGNVVGESRHTNQQNTALFEASNIATDGTATALTVTESCTQGTGHVTIAIVNYAFNDSTVTVEIGTTGEHGTRTQTLNLGSGPVETLCQVL